MTPLESTRAELYHAALHYTWARTRHDIDGEADDDRMVSVIARLEVASKAFAEASETKTPPGNHSGGAT